MRLHPTRLRMWQIMVVVSMAAVLLITPSKRLGSAEPAVSAAAAEEAPASPARAADTAAATVPPAGGMSVAVSGTASMADLLASIPFEATFLGLFDLAGQEWTTAVPGAPVVVNGAFSERLRPGALVWVRRSEYDHRGGVVWPGPTSAVAGSASQLVTPADGGITVGTAGTTSLSALIDAQAFTVALVTTFDVRLQQYLTYVPGAPPHVNTLTPDLVRPNTVVWVKRAERDPRAGVSPTVPTLAAVHPSGIPLDAGVRSAGIPAPGPAAAPASPPLQAPAAPAVAPAPAAPSLAPAPTSGVAGTVMRAVSYESGLSTTEQMQTSSSGLGTTSEAARRGTSAGYALLRAQDPQWSGGGFRAEWHGEDHTSGVGAERWHGISYYIPTDYNQGRNSTWNDRIIFQFADLGSPMFSLHLDAAREELWVRRKLPEKNADGSPRFQELARWKFSTQRWYDLAFHIRWTKDGSGIFEVYVDRERKVDYRGRTLGERDVTYSKWGIYGQPTRILFDEVKIATGADGLDAVSP